LDRKQKLGYVKGVDPQERSVTAYVSTYEWDRMQERFAKGAWDLESFRKNPVVLLQHQNQNFPVAKAVMIQEDENGLLSKAVFHDETEEARIAFRLYEIGFLNAFSVGFIPKSFAAETLPDGKGKGLVFTGAELFEYSVVSVPANPGATVTREVADLVAKGLGDGFLKKMGDDSFLVLPDMAPVPAGEPEDLSVALRQIKELARMVKGKPLDESKLALAKNAIDLLDEAIRESRGGVSAEDFARLKGAVQSYADVLASLAPANAEILKQTISQVASALTGRQG
jgi:HK97 family phage prohead protease